MQQRTKKLVWLVLLALVLGAQAMRAQAEPETLSKEQADKFFQAQEWVDSSAGVILTAGELRGNAMVLDGEHIYRNGRKEHYRGTWTPQPDGSVRQLLEQSRDGGKSWYVWFDGTYVRKK